MQRDNHFAHSPEEEAALVEFVGEILADETIDLPQAAVVDVGVICDLSWAVVEQNAAWGAGIYGCEPTQVLEVLRYAAVSV